MISPNLVREFFDAVLAVFLFVVSVLGVTFYAVVGISHDEAYRCIGGLPKRHMSERDRYAMLRWLRV